MTHRDTDIPELAELGLSDKPDGPGAAAFLAAGIGVFVLGFLTTLSEAWSGIGGFLGAFDFGVGVGPLAGKSILAVLAWLISWGILHSMWKDKDVDIRKMFWWGFWLGIVGLLGTFPPFFELFK